MCDKQLKQSDVIFKQALINGLLEDGMRIPDDIQLNQMRAYYNYLCEENKTHNLTRITSPERAAYDHFCDSLLPINDIREDSRLVDIGSGAGFPIVPLAIMKPTITATAIEASCKKCEFIKNTCTFLGINIEVLNARAEAAAHTKLRETYDVSTARAVAPLNILMELTSPFLKPGGLFLAYKSNEDEIAQAKKAAKILNLEFYTCVSSSIPGNGRRVFIYRKTGPLPDKYPRPFAKIKKAPL